MTFFVNQELPEEQTQLHALIIGVNYYPHLIDGGARSAPQTFGQGQLTSPVVSARRITDWLVQDYNNADVPLGSIELLLSQTSDHSEDNGSIEPTRDNIVAAFNRWYSRCEKSEDNIAWFYFCGHGLEANTTALLAQDYGADELNPWNGAIDFRKSFENMADFKCRHQVFLLDTCRKKINSTLSGLPTLKNSVPQNFPARDAPIFQSASLNSAARAPANQISYFCRALIDCLDALAASHSNGTEWVVDTSSLSRAIRKRMFHLPVGSHILHLSCDTGSGAHNLPPTVINLIEQGAVKVMSQISCDPADTEPLTRLELEETALGLQFTNAGKPKPWNLELPIGYNYSLQGHVVPSSGLTQVETFVNQTVYPPEFTRKVKVR